MISRTHDKPAGGATLFLPSNPARKNPVGLGQQPDRLPRRHRQFARRIDFDQVIAMAGFQHHLDPARGAKAIDPRDVAPQRRLPGLGQDGDS